MITLRPHQIKAADAIEDARLSGIMRPLADMCVGSGKSLTMGKVASRFWERRERSIGVAHVRELVQQNDAAFRALGLVSGINAASLGERTWRAPIISAAIQSVYKNASAFGPVANVMTDEAHLTPHSEAGMYREFHRGFPGAFFPGFSGTVFRLQGGSLVEGEGAPFDRVVYTYGILDGIGDGYLVPAFSATTDDKLDRSQLKTRQGEYDAASQDAQNIGMMDNHIAQMIQHGVNRRAWLVFEASVKAAKAMTARLNEWNVPTGLVLGETPAGERKAIIAAYRAGRLRCLVNVAALTTGFDVQEVDMLVMRRATKSLGLYIQMTGRLLRTIGGNIESSIAAGKPDGLVLDFAGNIDTHGPLDFIEPKTTKHRLVECEECGKRNGAAAARCWSCDALMTKLCPACLETITKGTLDCPHCAHDMRTGGAGSDPKPQSLLEKPSGAALISSFGAVRARSNGWIGVRAVRSKDEVFWVQVHVTDPLNEWIQLPNEFATHAKDARWIRLESGTVVAVLKRNGSSLGSALQVTADGMVLPVPMPAAA